MIFDTIQPAQELSEEFGWGRVTSQVVFGGVEITLTVHAKDEYHNSVFRIDTIDLNNAHINLANLRYQEALRTLRRLIDGYG